MNTDTCDTGTDNMPTRTTPPHSLEYVSLKEYIQSQIEALEKTMEKNCQIADKRMDSLNELRTMLQDVMGTLLTKAEFNIYRERIEEDKERIQEDIRSLRESRALLEGKASQSSVTISLIIGVSGLMLGLITLLVKIFGGG